MPNIMAQEFGFDSSDAEPEVHYTGETERTEDPEVVATVRVASLGWAPFEFTLLEALCLEALRTNPPCDFQTIYKHIRKICKDRHWRGVPIRGKDLDTTLNRLHELDYIACFDFKMRLTRHGYSKHQSSVKSPSQRDANSRREESVMFRVAPLVGEPTEFD